MNKISQLFVFLAAFFCITTVSAQLPSAPSRRHIATLFNPLIRNLYYSRSGFSSGNDGYFTANFNAPPYNTQNYVFAPDMLSGIKFLPMGSPGFDHSAISDNHLVWWGHDLYTAQGEIRFTVMSQQGVISSQFKMNGYGLVDMVSDTAGRIYCLYSNATGFGMMRFSGSTTPDFQKWVNVVGSGFHRSRFYARDDRFYFPTVNGIYVLDTNGDVVRVVQGLSPNAKYVPFDDHSFAVVEISRQDIKVLKYDSAATFLWGTQFDGRTWAGHGDTLLSQLDGLALPGSDELFLLYKTQSNTPSSNNCGNSVNVGTVSHALLTEEGELKIVRFNTYANNYSPAPEYSYLGMTNDGTPAAITGASTCILGAYSRNDAVAKVFNTIPYGVDCYPGGFLPPQTSITPTGPITFTTGSSIAQSIPFLPDTMAVLITNYSQLGGLTCFPPCVNLDTAISLGGGLVQFEDNIHGFHSVEYIFGDGSTGNSADPLHQFPGAGSYPTMVIATNECGSDTSYISVNPCLAASIVPPVGGCQGDTAIFVQGTSFPGDSISWLVNGSFAGIGDTMQYVPSAIGTDQIGIVYQDGLCADTNYISFAITTGLPSPNFAMTSFAGFGMNFTNLSTNVLSYSWDFGDGSGDSIANPSHVYNSAGPFTICLTGVNACGTEDTCIAIPCPLPHAEFTTIATSGQAVMLSDSSFNGTITWDFGDGTTANGSQTSHSYTSGGTYTICQYVTAPCAVDTFCQTLTIVSNNADYWRQSYDLQGVTDITDQATDQIGQTLILGKASAGYFAMLIDSAGAEQWTKIYSDTAYQINSVCTMANGNFLVVGAKRISALAYYDALWMEMDLAGNVVQSKTIPFSLNQVARDVRKAHYGGYLISGFEKIGFSASGLNIKIREDLSVEWSRRIEEITFGAIQAADSSYWVVQRDFYGPDRLMFVHLNQAGTMIEEYSTPYAINLVYTQSENQKFSLVSDCNGDIFVLATIEQHDISSGVQYHDIGLFKFNTNTFTSARKVTRYYEASNVDFEYDVFGEELMVLPTGELLGLGFMQRRGNPFADAKRIQLRWLIDRNNLSMNVLQNGSYLDMEAWHAGSLYPNGVVLAGGIVDSTLTMSKTTSSLLCAEYSSNFLYLLQDVAGNGPLNFTNLYNYNLPLNVFPYASEINASVSQTTPQVSQAVECSSPCAPNLPIQSSFTYTVNGNTATLISTATPGAIIQWQIPGQACLSTSDTIVVPLNCGNTTISLIASTPCNYASSTQTIFNPNGGPSSATVWPNLLQDSIICFGTSPILVESAFGFTNHLWSNAATTSSTTFAAPATFWVTAQATGNNCYYTDSASITVRPSLGLSIGPDTSVCPSTIIPLQTSGSYTYYNWSNGIYTPQSFAITPGLYAVTVTDSVGCTASDTMELFNYQVATASIGGNQTVCIGDSATFVVSPSFTSYLWNTSSTDSMISPIVPGTYSVSVTDSNGCGTSASATLSNYPSVSVSLGPDFDVCPDSLSSLDAGAGFSSYAWSNGANTQVVSGLLAGSYSVTVTDANGCTGDDAIVIGNLPVNSLSAGADQSVCPGTQVSLSSSAGFLSYAWSNGASGPNIFVTNPGNYVVTATAANGCTVTDTVSVFNFTPPVVFLGNDTFISVGNTITIDAGPGFSQYLWNTGGTTQSLTGTLSGVYWVEVADSNGCTGRDTIEIFLVPAPNIGITYNGMSVNVSGTPNGMASYYWTFGNGDTANGQNVNYTYSVPGTYQICLTITTSQGFTSTTCITVTVPGPLGLANESGYQFEVSPVPAGSRLNVKAIFESSDCVEFSLHNGLGQIVWSKHSDCQDQFDFQIDVNQLSNGIYFLKMQGGRHTDMRRIEVLR